MPALEPLHGLRVVADPAALDAASLASRRHGHRPPLRARRRVRRRRGRRSISTTRRDRRGRGRLRRRVVHRRCPRDGSSPATSSGRSRPSGRRSPRAPIAGVPAKLWLRVAAPTDGAACARSSPGGLRRRAAGPPPMSELHARRCCRIRWPDGRRPPTTSSSSAAAGTACSTAYHLATRHGITNVAVARGRLHRSRQHRPQHDDHPRQLRHPRGDPLLPALARAVPGPRGGDRRRRSSTRPRASSGSPTPRWRCAPSAPAAR